MKITHQFLPYDERRWLTPSFAVVTAWNEGQRPAFRFGAPLHGDVRVWTVEANPNDVVHWRHQPRRVSGVRTPRADAPRPPTLIAGYGIVQADGTVREVSEADAKAHLRKR